MSRGAVEPAPGRAGSARTRAAAPGSARGGMPRKPGILEVSSEGVGGGAKHVYDLVRSLGEHYTFIVACPDNGPYFERFKRLGVEVLELPAKPLSPSTLLRLSRATRRGSIELVHVHGRKAGWWGRLASLTSGRPVIYTLHGLHHRKHGVVLQRIYLRTENLLSRCTARVINVSSSEQRECLELGIVDAERSLVIPNGIDAQALDLIDVDVRAKKAELGLTSGDVVVGTVAKFDVQKGHEYLAAAIPGIVRECPAARFLLVGEGKLRPEIERRVESLGVRERVVFTGPRHDDAELLRAVDVVVLPSRWEGLSLFLLEAMACRKPVVATAVTGNVDVVVDGVTGFLVPPGDPRALAEKVVRLLQDEQLRLEFGRQGRARVEALFSLGRMLDRVRAVYDEILNR